jgi:hypothetical protein
MLFGKGIFCHEALIKLLLKGPQILTLFHGTAVEPCNLYMKRNAG